MEIVRGISQVMANSHDGALDDNGDPIKVGLKREEGDPITDSRIMDGFKVVVCKLRTNALGYTSIAYPTDQLRLPKWFQELPFDDLYNTPRAGCDATTPPLYTSISPI